MFSNQMYETVEVASTGVGVNPAADSQVNTGETGVMGDIAKREMQESDYKERSVKGALVDVLTKLQVRDVYRVDIPVNKIAWQTLALKRANTTYVSICGGVCSPSQQVTLNNLVLNYFIQLFLSLFIAVLTMYLFYLMLDALPFIGSGVMDASAISPLGSGGTSTPGSALVEKGKELMGKMMGGGK
jgi:hypothetical protein